MRWLGSANRHDPTAKAGGGRPAYDVGTLGHIQEVEALPDGRFNIVLVGEARFRILREMTVVTPFRQVEAELLPDPNINRSAPSSAPCSNVRRATLRCARLCGRLGADAAGRSIADQWCGPDRAL
jgi:Lon protease-like protein